jgi:hypothetical protein
MLKNISEITNMILSGERLFIAGDESILNRLPKGNWIGGTIPYFMDKDGGKIERSMAQVIPVPEEVADIKIVFYDEDQLPTIPSEAYENGFSFIIIPGMSAVHLKYAMNAPDYEGMFIKNILGWISGVHLDDFGKITPKVFNGNIGEGTDQKAVVMHCKVKEGKLPVIGTLNLFEQGDGDTVNFENTSFSVKECIVEGKKINFAEYLMQKNIDTRLPLVANYSGAMVNVSFQSIDKQTGEVLLYAPVFPGVDYKIAKPVNDYVKEFNQIIFKNKISPVLSCNCILNFLYAELEGKKTEGVIGPITFGEIAYQLLNQTLVYLEIQNN